MVPEWLKRARKTVFWTFLVAIAVLFNVALVCQNRFFSPVQEHSIQSSVNRPTFSENYIHVAFFAKYAYKKMKLSRGIMRTFQSILEHTQEPLYLHVLLDAFSQKRTYRILKKTVRSFHRQLNVTFYDVDDIIRQNQDTVDYIKRLFFHRDVGRYNDPIFFLTEVFHEVFPRRVRRVVFLDLDVVFREDIGKLNALFGNFTEENVIGIGPDLQPQYRSDFARYRLLNANTSVGSPRPGLQGFNTGVVLFDLEKMRKSNLYNRLLDPNILEGLCQKYQFEGFLGHQDFFTLTGMEYPELYYHLDCSWNRQLDTGWRNEFGDAIFEQYHKCDGKIKVFHANGDAMLSFLT